MKHLVKKANRYYIHWNIPKDVRHHFTGLAVYSRSLKTGSLGQALVRRDHLLAELEGIVRQASAASEDQQFLALVTEIRRASTTSQVIYCEPAPVVPVVANEPTQGITLQSAVTAYTHEEGGTLDPSNVSRLNLAPQSFLTYLNLKDVPLEAIDKRDVITWVIESAKTKALRTAKAYANCLLKVWDWAYRSKEVSGDNPFKGLDLRLASSSSKRTAFTVKQVASLVATAGPAMKALMKFALVTGCRLGELATLNTQDFHELEGVHYFIIKEGKT